MISGYRAAEERRHIIPYEACRHSNTIRLSSNAVKALRPARTLSVSIAARVADVYAFVADPRRLPEWATGLGSTPTPLPDGTWRVETPAVDVPLRVMPNGNGSEVMLTLFQQAGMSDGQYAADAALVQADLARLKHALER